MRPNTKALQRTCDKFNAKHPIGTPGLVKLDGEDTPFPTKTRTIAQVMSGHTAMIWLGGVSGCYLLDRFTPSQKANCGGAA